MPNTPSGTRIWPTLMPLGRRLTPVISPTGSGMAASCSQPSATVAMTLASELQAVDHRRGQAGGFGGGDVLRVGALLGIRPLPSRGGVVSPEQIDRLLDDEAP
jgi:hypothetical protein